jgi:hypothetical protein
VVAGERNPGYDKFCLDVVGPTHRILGPEVGQSDLVLDGLDERLLLQAVGQGLHGGGGGDVDRRGVVGHGAYVSAASPGLLLAGCGLLAGGWGGRCCVSLQKVTSKKDDQIGIDNL